MWFFEKTAESKAAVTKEQRKQTWKQGEEYDQHF